jgi:hypothetical protein
MFRRHSAALREHSLAPDTRSSLSSSALASARLSSSNHHLGAADPSSTHQGGSRTGLHFAAITSTPTLAQVPGSSFLKATSQLSFLPLSSLCTSHPPFFSTQLFAPPAHPRSRCSSSPSMNQLATPDPSQARGVTLEEILSGTRCSPLTLRELEGFLTHVSTVQQRTVSIAFQAAGRLPKASRRRASLRRARRAAGGPSEPSECTEEHY